MHLSSKNRIQQGSNPLRNEGRIQSLSLSVKFACCTSAIRSKTSWINMSWPQDSWHYRGAVPASLIYLWFMICNALRNLFLLFNELEEHAEVEERLSWFAQLWLVIYGSFSHSTRLYLTRLDAVVFCVFALLPVVTWCVQWWVWTWVLFY